ncbi:prenyltransferase/squalene oxidase repeat-containing protein [Streptacidiphilus sp. ASG 303]|uniref:prenyltransferase/squalene oxidase repeat-containing protein n=1 Tax=Streptacidiphilus sp. ASG 303 TaxID=2896847 RepID=UPI002107E8F9|nr:prenyltransferase/squalene oxidase repeat-containing protein [Streptacidiphilus sp. ASG 303]
MLSAAARAGAALACAALLTGTAAAPALADDSASPAASAASPSPVAVPPGLYGKDDPTYDGVWRQSLALLALHTAQVRPADAAVRWLTGQQCGDGGWPSFRADTADACTAATEDSNATALAVQALTALGGHDAATARGVSWLRRHQNPDGGWSYNPGGASDGNSTGLAVNALVAAKADPAQVRKHDRSAYDGLASFQLGCDAPAAKRGAFAYQPDKSGALEPNDLASAQALLAAAGGALPVAPGARREKPAAAPDCAAGAKGALPRESSAEADAHFLVGRLAAGKQRLMQSLPGAAPAPDYNATSWAVLGLVAAGHPDQASDAADWLAGNGYAWMQGKQGVNPASAATLLLVAKATGLDPYNFGGSNVVQMLVNSGPAPASLPSAAASAASAAPDGTKAPGSSVTGADEDENGGFSPVWLIGMGLAAGIGGGVFLSRRGKRGPAGTAPAAAPASAAPADDARDGAAAGGGDDR